MYPRLLAVAIVLASTPLAVGQMPAGFPAPPAVDSRVVRLPPVDAGPTATEWMVQAPAALASQSPEVLSPGAGLPPIESLPPGRLAPVPLVEDEPPAIKLWEGSLELGLDGASGNNESFNFHFAFKARRRTALNALTLQLDYFKKTDQNQETANRLFDDWRLEHFFVTTPWTCYVHGTVEYDEFAAFDTRVTSDAGLGYRLWDTEPSLLIARCGAGVSREFGSPSDRLTPEAVFGLDFQHRLGIRHRLIASVEYMPDITEFGHCRINSQAAWEYLLDQQINLSLKLGILDRYTSTPYGKKPNDLNYGAVLLWKF